VVRLLRYILRSAGVGDSPAIGVNLRWFIGMCCVAAVVALFISFFIYWRYRLTPERAAALDANYDRDEATITAVKLTGSALIFMAVMMTLFRRALF